MKYVLGIIFIIVGFIIVWKSTWFAENFGTIEYAEDKLGSWGGTNFFYKLIGLAVILAAFLLMSGGLVPILSKLFNPTTPG
jgi:hypothetical protein